MKLLTAAIIKKLNKTPIYTHQSTPPDRVPIICKFFDPYGMYTWYCTEGEEVEVEDESGRVYKDWKFFGMVHGHEKELGYFMLSELASLRKFGKPRIERDMWYEGHMLSEVM